jgi:hypothetical protein
MGAEGEKLWTKLTQGVGRGNAQQAKEAIDAVTKAMGDYEQKLKDAQAAEQDVADRMSHLTDHPGSSGGIREGLRREEPARLHRGVEGV